MERYAIVSQEDATILAHEYGFELTFESKFVLVETDNEGPFRFEEVSNEQMQAELNSLSDQLDKALEVQAGLESELELMGTYEDMTHNRSSRKRYDDED